MDKFRELRNLIELNKSIRNLVAHISDFDENTFNEGCELLFTETFTPKDMIKKLMICANELKPLKRFMEKYLNGRKLLTQEESYEFFNETNRYVGDIYKKDKIEYLISKSVKCFIIPPYSLHMDLNSEEYCIFLLESIRKGDIFSKDGIIGTVSKSSKIGRVGREINSIVEWIELGLVNMRLFSSSL